MVFLTSVALRLEVVASGFSSSLPEDWWSQKQRVEAKGKPKGEEEQGEKKSLRKKRKMNWKKTTMKQPQTCFFLQPLMQCFSSFRSFRSFR